MLVDVKQKKTRETRETKKKILNLPDGLLTSKGAFGDNPDN